MFGEVESQLLVMWAVSALVLAGTIPPVVWMLEPPNNKTTGGSVARHGIPSLPAMILPVPPDDDGFYDGWDNWEYWELVDHSPGSAILPDPVIPATTITGTGGDGPQDSDSDYDERDAIVWWSPSKRHARSFPRALRRSGVNLRNSLHRIE